MLLRLGCGPLDTEVAMSRRKKDPLRLLTDAERNALMQLSRSQVASAVHVSRAIMLLSVAGGSDYQTAARNAGRRSSDAVSHLEAGLSYQRNRTWCATGISQRKRKSGMKVVTDPDAESKKS